MAHVLVVDDEADIRRLVRFSLEFDDHDVTEAVDGVDALRSLADDIPDVVVLDLTMPRLDGWEVLVRLKASSNARLAAVPVVLLTAIDTDLERIRGGIEGAVRYLTKPFDPDDLRGEVQRAIDDPEPEQRRRAALESLERLAALERGDRDLSDGRRPAPAHPHVTRLGGPLSTGPARIRPRRLAAEQLRSLSANQGRLLRAVAAAPTVRAAAENLGVSRSNVYASLRRIARRLEVASVTELVAQAREGVDDVV